ncbi:hypothetical protein I5G67_gp003 [Mycobacterium phage Aminay]|uniref:Acb2/Tad1 hairpin domain-containing protein n=1 Tax=Mycobacterium phage Aminay TaxID=2250291 RepID=A0A345KUY9_9CAUD|nr:hypothetical protein I5G67_gp003 [Mycobacterium phage Aminay]AXH46841.1 hypothetical protein SEA_AMINAY_3 [Mycobacterium phage Aminay]
MSYATDASSQEISRRFTLRAGTIGQQNAAETVRSACRQLAHDVDELIEPGRQKALALTAIEEAMHWALAAIACGGDPATMPAPAPAQPYQEQPRPARPGQTLTLAEVFARDAARRGES